MGPASVTEHTKTDGIPATGAASQVPDRARARNERMAADKIECNACPVLCQISPGKTGACDRYANADGVLIRVDPVVLLRPAGLRYGIAQLEADPDYLP